MLIDIDVQLDYDLAGITDILLQIEASPLIDQSIQRAHIDAGATEHFFRIPAEEAVGERIWLRVTDRFVCSYTARMEIQRQAPDISRLLHQPVHMLPPETIKYLMASRYCPSDEFQSFAAAEFGNSMGGERMVAILNWITDNLAYVPGVSGPWTTATDTFVQRQGICRDFAHVCVTLARASAIPARIVSVYAPEIDPPDFHAVAQVFLDGKWHLVDPTGMTTPDRMAIVGVGRDAADIAFMTLYGSATLNRQSVTVNAV
ncbi:Transglutaminase-like enzyme, putative cysteine protease [Tranquillimonas rosea]|uniref:Transglutaminase-like enzyme, putative cysteine protease n=1 Tax=Tranquillimonas rosea TaxID=641238 RepID=A0A1H9V878_9RHOB|nr:transglutaminase family protein [Tranquillimonas rosea]SES17614.1 Transglutaminase-like enzyme, putative cysteine protease [Tranquillimonas rosea]